MDDRWNGGRTCAIETFDQVGTFLKVIPSHPWETRLPFGRPAKTPFQINPAGNRSR